MSMSETRHPMFTVALPTTWPEPPSTWHFSLLKDVEACPHRWALSTASFPAVWDGNGYPSILNSKALAGQVIHAAVGAITLALANAGCREIREAASVEVLRKMGGFTAILRDTIDRIIDRHHSNPRVRDTLELLRNDLMQEMPAMRQQIQQHLQRVNLVERRQGNMSGGGPLAEGSYHKLRLRATALDFVGIVDLLQIAEGRCTLWEFKTGQPDTRHIEQLRAYALLWVEDKQRNPGRIPIQRLVLSYGTHYIEFPSPDENELEALRVHLKDRIAQATASIQSDSTPPVARPSPDNCKFCGVRQLCSGYWSSLALWNGADRPEWTDVEVRVRTARGPRSWNADLLIARGANCGPAVLIMASTSRTLDEGAHMRLLNVRMDVVDGVTQISITAFSEMFKIASH